MNDFDSFISTILSGSIESIKTPNYSEFLNKPWGPLKRCPIHLACYAGHTNIVKLLIDKNCDIELFDKDNWQPIHLACERGHVDIVRLLTKAKCGIDAVNQNGDSPMKLAEKGGNKQIIELLNERKKELELLRIRTNEGIEQMIINMGVKCNLFCSHKLLCPKSIRESSFQKGGKIGKGSFGSAYLMKCHGTDQEFVVKIVEIGKVGRRYIEGKLDEFIPILDHPRIIKYFGAIENEKHLFIYMEYCPKKSLLHKIYQDKTIQPNEVIRYTRQILEGLEFLHGIKVIHRDLNPANILLTNDDDIKLTDFGNSRSIIKTGGITAPAITFVGTANFMAPEVINNEPYGKPADIWSVAATMVNMITGNPPYALDKQVTVLFKIGNTKTIEVPSSISDDMRTFMESMISPDPSQRPTATELLNSNFFKAKI